ncbi:hypothetical protein PMKS-003302 [Pichia membranifaciens]|uniref:Ketopantoate reductase N-terminal domain-containing protein n=1 Tax=Pichia membranifaciens TaxID=4926 RepID=A0A1Q2YJR7_9ASCO|nr:hypothetical protein PMKS-003302 [Pichia membranifaciens]
MAPKILLIGIGGVGSIAAYTLKANGAEVTAIARSSYDVLKEDGFTIESLDYGKIENFKPDHVFKDVAEAAKERGPFDYIVVTTKNIPDVAPVEKMIEKAYSKDTAIVLLENGVGIDRSMFKAYPDATIISGVTMISSTLYGTTVKHVGSDTVSFGPFLNPSLEKEPQVAKAKAFTALYYNEHNGAKYEADSIHLDSLLQDAESSVWSFESQSEEEEEDEKKEDAGAYGASNSQDSLPKTGTPCNAELSFLPNTPTRRALDYTPVNSPEAHMQVTPQYSMGSTPKMHLHAYHNHTFSSLSTNSAKGDTINDSFIYNGEHADPHGGSSVPQAVAADKDRFKEMPQFRQILSTHQHTNSAATTDLSKPGVDPDFAADLDDSLMRSASVPIKRKKSVAEARTPAPRTPLPAPPTHLATDQSKHQVMPSSDLVDARKEHGNHVRSQFSPQAHHHYYNNNDNNNGGYQFPNKHQLHPQVLPSSPHRTSQQFYQQSPHGYNGAGGSFPKRGLVSPSSNQMHYAPSPQPYQHRNFNPQYGPYGHFSRSTSHPKVPQLPHSQPVFHPQQQQQQPQQQRPYGMHTQHQQHQYPQQYPGASSPYYKTSQRHGYSPQTSPKVGYFNLAPGNHPSKLEYEGRHAPSTPPSHIKKNMQLRDVDLSHVMPR